MSEKRQSTRRMIKAFLRPWWRRPLSLVAGFALAMVAGRIALDPWLTAKIRGNLALLETAGVVTFRDLQVSLFPPSIALTDLAFRGRSGESLDVDRLEVSVSSLRELLAAVPHVGVKMVRPNLRATPGARDLDRLVRGLPTARVDVATVSNGRVSHSGSGSNGRPVLDSLSGAVEGLATGTEVGQGGWKFSADGRLADLKPARLAVNVASAGTWEMALTARVPPGPAADAHPIDIAALVNGNGGRLKAMVHVAWVGPKAPVMLARDTLSGLSDKWPTENLKLVEARESAAPPAHALDLIMVEGAGVPVADAFHPRAAIGVAVNVVRLSTEVLIPPSEGLASGVNDNRTRPGTSVAVNLEDDHGGD